MRWVGNTACRNKLKKFGQQISSWLIIFLKGWEGGSGYSTAGYNININVRGIGYEGVNSTHLFLSSLEGGGESLVIKISEIIFINTAL